jgi:hypothetical protein
MNRTHGTARHLIIDTGEVDSFNDPTRKPPYYATKLMGDKVNELKSNRLIDPVNTQWGSPLVSIPNEDSSYNCLVDYRKLNGLTKSLPLVVPKMSSLITNTVMMTG